MVRVEALVDFYRQAPNIRLDAMDSFTDVTIQDLETLLDALKDRSMSSAVSEIFKRPKFKTPREIERDAKLAKIIVDEREIEEDTKITRMKRDLWTRGYDKGYEAGRNGELKRIEGLINRYLHDREHD